MWTLFKTDSEIDNESVINSLLITHKTNLVLLLNIEKKSTCYVLITCKSFTYLKSCGHPCYSALVLLSQGCITYASVNQIIYSISLHYSN